MASLEVNPYDIQYRCYNAVRPCQVTQGLRFCECRTVAYCCKDCQKVSWAEHKSIHRQVMKGCEVCHKQRPLARFPEGKSTTCLHCSMSAGHGDLPAGTPPTTPQLPRGNIFSTDVAESLFPGITQAGPESPTMDVVINDPEQFRAIFGDQALREVQRAIAEGRDPPENHFYMEMPDDLSGPHIPHSFEVHGPAPEPAMNVSQGHGAAAPPTPPPPPGAPPAASRPSRISARKREARMELMQAFWDTLSEEARAQFPGGPFEGISDTSSEPDGSSDSEDDYVDSD